MKTISHEVKETKFPVDLSAPPKNPERLLRRLAIVGVIASLWAWKYPQSFAKITFLDPNGWHSIPRRLFTAASVALALRCEVPALALIVLDRSIYVRRGYGDFASWLGCSPGPHPDWRYADHKIEAIDAAGRAIHGHLFLQESYRKTKGPSAPAEREIVIVCGGNGTVYDEWNPGFIKKLFPFERCDVVFFSPPGYGQTAGVRTPHGDRLALEAVVQALLKAGYTQDKMTLYGISIGSGMVSHVASQYPVKRVLLKAPFAQMQTVVQRIARRTFGRWLGDGLTWCLRDIVRDHFEYDNAAALAGVSNVSILQGGKDELMTWDCTAGDPPNSKQLSEPRPGELMAEAMKLRTANQHGATVDTVEHGDHNMFDDDLWAVKKAKNG
jgi:hypothetical protein